MGDCASAASSASDPSGVSSSQESATGAFFAFDLELPDVLILRPARDESRGFVALLDIVVESMGL